jgi:hypothetical protein
VKGLHIWLLIAVVLGASALGMACKSKKKTGGTSTPKSTVSKTVANKTGTPSVKTGTPSAKTGTPSSSTSGGDANSQLSSLANSVKNKEGKVAYNYTSTDAQGTKTQGTFTIYSKPPDGSRFDFDDGAGTSGSIITSGGKSYVCGEGICTESPIASSALPFASYFTDPQSLLGLIGDTAGGVKHTTKTVAGKDADCYSASNDQGSGEVCFSSDGLLLSIHGGDSTGGTFDLEATSASGSVPAADLTPPFPIQSIPGAP